jgi:flavin-dependent dehydrogenase
VSTSRHDVIVVGGGPAGCAAVLTIVRGGASVALVERTHYDDLRWGESVSPAIRRPLDHLGMWDRFRQSPHRPSLGVESYWGSSEPAYRDFLLHPGGNGWHLDRRRFDAMLADESIAAGATLWRARVKGAQWASGSWHVTTTEGSLHARVLINAAGRHASFRMPIAGRRRFSDHSVVVVQVFKTTAMPSGWTVIEATANGWAYTAPFPGGCHVLMFFTDPDLLRRTSCSTLLSSLPQMSRRLSGAVACGRPLVQSASAWCRSHVAGAGWLSVGDAASTVDPLSGQGLHRALTDGIAAGRASLAMLAGDRDPTERFQRRIHRRFSADRETSRSYYRAERRWPDAPFWRRRHESP